MLRVFGSNRNSGTKKLPFAAGVLVAIVAVFGVAIYAPQKAAASADCDNNAVIYCGFSSASNFISKVNANDSGNGFHDLKTVYAAYGLTSADYSNFAAHAVAGTAYKDGTIVVNGQVVARNAESIGRLAKSYSHNKVIGGKTYYESRAQDVFLSNSIPVMVLFDGNGTIKFSALTACGNPIAGDAVQTSASCKALTATPVAGKANTYNFTAQSSPKGNAKLIKLVYDFGDNTAAKTISSNFGQAVQHTYGTSTLSTDKTYTAKVTEYFSVPGSPGLVTAHCTKSITVKAPPSSPAPRLSPTYSCTAVASPIVVDKMRNIYKFTVTGAYAYGAFPSSAVFDFGDKHPQTVPMTGKTTTTNHQFVITAANKAYTIKVTLHFTVSGKDKTATSTKCQTKLTVPAPTYACLELRPYTVDKTKFSYRYVATGKVSDGVKLLNADFKMGDGTTKKAVQANGSTVTLTYQYAKPGTYNSGATLHFTAYDGTPLTAHTCTAMVSPTAPPTPTCKPNVPVGSPECIAPCQPGSSVPPESAECQPPELPNTGAGNVIAVFAAVVIGGFLVYRQILFRQHKRAFVAAEQGSSPLPLGDPLNNAPLQNTPLAAKRRGFRRKRQF